MTCSSCSCDLATGAQFCVRCGKPQATAYAAPQPQAWSPVAPQFVSFAADPQARVSRNLQALGIAWCLFGVCSLFAVTFGLHAAHFGGGTGGFGGHGGHGGMGGQGGGTWPGIGFSSVFSCGLSVLAGLGLLSRKSWARKLAMFLAAFALFAFPIGTVLGVYTLWVLGSCAARKEWRRLQVTSSY